MSADRSFAEIMGRLRDGDRDAAAEVFHRFAHRLIALARSRLDNLLCQKFDPEDVLQSVYQSFFLRHAQGQYAFDSWDGLWALLTLITVRKCSRRREHFHAARRDVQREAGPPTAAEGPGWDVLARDPTPSEAVSLAETVERLMEGLNPREREILTLSLQGYTTAEIGARVGRTERTVQRLLQRVRRHLEALEAEAGP
jgi:RNA polymerase sigma-70 factor (ECF subfamily)